jgi:hypothetical protein
LNDAGCFSGGLDVLSAKSPGTDRAVHMPVSVSRAWMSDRQEQRRAPRPDALRAWVPPISVLRYPIPSFPDHGFAGWTSGAGF